MVYFTDKQVAINLDKLLWIGREDKSGSYYLVWAQDTSNGARESSCSYPSEEARDAAYNSIADILDDE